jgi:Ca-activated chloride channel homolog
MSPIRSRIASPAPRLAGLVVSAGLLAGVLIAGCTGSSVPQPTSAPSVTGSPYTLQILAGSELADMQPILQEARKATGVNVKLSYAGTLAGTQEILSGNTAGAQAVWFSSTRYLALYQGGRAKLDASSPIMASPVILGVRTTIARQLGWISKRPSWADIAGAAAAHKFTFIMSNPVLSNSGFSALVSVATAVAGNGGALQAGELPAAIPALRGLFTGLVFTRASSGQLIDAYLKAQDDTAQGQPVIDGLIGYESQMLSLNTSGKLHEQLTLIYPTEGAVTADYPLSLLASAPPAARNAYLRLVNYLLTPAVQRQIMLRTGRRPVSFDVSLDSQLRGPTLKHWLYGLPFPATSDVVNDLLVIYASQLRRPARTIYVLDTSGSMAGARIAGLKSALDTLTGGGNSLMGRLTQFQEREQVTIITFNTMPGPPHTFDVPASNPEPALAQIRSYSDSLTAGGWTAAYDAVEEAYQVIQKQAATDPNRITTIVLLTDGWSNRGATLAQFATFYHRLPGRIASAPVYPILFGQANTAQMQQLAQLTGGQVFDARQQSLATVFLDIRGNQ